MYRRSQWSATGRFARCRTPGGVGPRSASSFGARGPRWGAVETRPVYRRSPCRCREPAHLSSRTGGSTAQGSTAAETPEEFPVDPAKGPVREDQDDIAGLEFRDEVVDDLLDARDVRRVYTVVAD